MGKTSRKLRVIAAAQEQAAAVSDVDRIVFGLRSQAVDSAKRGTSGDRPWVALKYFDSSFECLSDWQASELKQLSKFFGMLAEVPWRDMGRHGGLQMKKYEVNDMEAGKEILKRIVASISPDIEVVELRVTQRIRVHGFRVTEAFFLVLLDREHRVFPE